jgi:NADPH-dependent 2,4-dienoyl-CoA reductase/sulfur reductase-like enzyme
VLKSGGRLEASLVLVGVGARPATDLFAGQLELVQGPPGGIKVNGHLQVCCACFLVRWGGGLRRVQPASGAPPDGPS